MRPEDGKNLMITESDKKFVVVNKFTVLAFSALIETIFKDLPALSYVHALPKGLGY